MRKIFAIIAAFAIIATACNKQELDDMRKRLDKLEEWQSSINNSITQLQALLKAQETKDLVKSVTPLADGSGYVLHFANSGDITILHGKEGSSPVVSAQMDADNTYYWTIDGEWMLSDGEKVPVAGTAPQIRVNSASEKWEVSTDGGTTWVSTGIRAQGDAVFAKDGIDNTHPDYVEVTLADGVTKIQLSRYKTFRIGDDNSNATLELMNGSSIDIPLILPDGLKEADFVALWARVGDANDVQTKAVTTHWKIQITKPTFTNGICNNNAKLTITLTDVTEMAPALLKVTLVGTTSATTITTSRLIQPVID